VVVLPQPLPEGVRLAAVARLALHQYLGGQLVDELAVDVGVEVKVPARAPVIGVDGIRKQN
jgi:hypothetical protein